MANAMYPLVLKKFLTGGIDMEGDTIKICLLDNGYTYSATHEFLDDITGSYRVATSSAIGTPVAEDDGTFTCGDVTFSTLSGDNVERWVMFKDTGTESTSPLICYFDTKADSSALNYTPNGSDYTLVFSAEVFSI